MPNLQREISIKTLRPHLWNKRDKERVGVSVEGVGERRERKENGEMRDRLGWEERYWRERGREKKRASAEKVE